MTAERTVLVTGANSGIGLASVVELAGRGFHAVGSVRSQAKAEHVHEAAEDAGVEVDTTILDVTDAERCGEVIDLLRPYAIVNNAGFPINGAVEDIADDEARAALETMTIAPIRLARLGLPHMRAQGGGRIVQVSSIYGRFTTPLTGWYQAAKHALEAASDALRMEVARDGIHVILVEPGGIRTDLWEDAREEFEKRGSSRYEHAYEATLQRIAMFDPFMREPRAVARTIVTAVTTRVPRPRYLVGADARTAALAGALVPDLIRDRISRFTLGL